MGVLFNISFFSFLFSSSVYSIQYVGGLTIRYASLRNSSAVLVDGRRDSRLGMVFAACFSVKRWLTVGVRSGMSLSCGGIVLSC